MGEYKAVNRFSVKLTCPDGYFPAREEDVMNCEEDLTTGGNMTGKWMPQFLTCQVCTVTVDDLAMV